MIGLLIASIGVYGLTSYSVAQRTNEIGIRIAIGASPNDVLRSFLVGATWQIGVGLGVGVLGAFAVSGLVRSVIGRVSPTDPMSYVIAVGVLAAAAVCGALVLARRAVRVDPVAALRIH